MSKGEIKCSIIYHYPLIPNYLITIWHFLQVKLQLSASQRKFVLIWFAIIYLSFIWLLAVIFNHSGDQKSEKDFERLGEDIISAQCLEMVKALTQVAKLRFKIQR